MDACRKGGYMNKQLEKLLARIQDRDAKIKELENTEIVGIVRELGLTPEQLAARFADQLPAKKPRKKEDNMNDPDYALQFP